MPSDEEFRKVAEDMRALARSLARDVWDASQRGRGEGRTAADALSRGLREALHGARHEFRDELRRRRRSGPAWPDPSCHQPPWQRHRRPGPSWSGGPRPGPPDGTGTGPADAPGFDNAAGGGPSYPRRRTRSRRCRAGLPPVRRRWDGPALLAAVVAGFGVAWLLGAVGAAHLSIEAVLAVGLMLLGVALIVTARTDWGLSRHGWPVALGLVLVVGLWATSTSYGVAGAFSHLSFGDLRATAPPAGGTVYGGFGRLAVDATKVRPGAVLRIQSVVGQTVVQLAPGETALVNGRVLVGQVCIDGRDRGSGLGATSGPVTLPAGRPSFTVDVRQLAGQVTVGPPGCARP